MKLVPVHIVYHLAMKQLQLSLYSLHRFLSGRDGHQVEWAFNREYNLQEHAICRFVSQAMSEVRYELKKWEQ